MIRRKTVDIIKIYFEMIKTATEFAFAGLKGETGMITTVTLNPAVDKTIEIESFTIGTVNRVSVVRSDPGGKGINVSKVVAALGGNSRVMAVLGGASGFAIADALKTPGLTVDLLFTGEETRTNIKIIDRVGHTNTDINERGKPVDNAVLAVVLEKLLTGLAPGDIVVLAGSLPEGAPRTLYRDWTAACKAKGAKVFLDADDDLLALGVTAAPFLVKPNSDELSRLCGGPLTTRQALIAAGRSLLEQGIERVVVSLGAKGALLLTQNKTQCAEGLKVAVKSTVGAGDAMVAALAYGEECGLETEEAFRLAIAASAASVMCSGTQAAALSEIEELLPLIKIQRLDGAALSYLHHIVD